MSMKKKIFKMIMIVSSLILSSALLQPVTAADKITLNFVSFVPKMNITYREWAPLFIDKINERAKGELFIKYRGGPEVIGGFDQAKAVAKGTIDMAMVPTSFYPGVVPGADTMRLSKISTAKERANGTYDLQREIHEKAGIYFVGNSTPVQDHFFWVCLRKPVKTREDFKGLKIGGSPPFLPCFKALGASPVKAGLPQYYPSVERGVFDGNIIGMDVYLAIHEYEVAPYVIDHPFYKSTNVIIMNLKKWNSLPDHLKKLIDQVQMETEQAMLEVWEGAVAGMKKKAMKEGAKFIKLEPDTAKWYVNTFYDVGWKYSEEKFPPDVIRKFKRLISESSKP